MQMSIPDVMNLAGESAATLAAYGVEGGSELRGSYARNCILARRLLERGVRVVQLFNGSDPSGGNGITNWDSHQNILKTHAMQAEIMDQPTAAFWPICENGACLITHLSSGQQSSAECRSCRQTGQGETITQMHLHVS